MKICPLCDGELQVERFDHPRKPTTWFLRCRECQAIVGEDRATEEEARGALVADDVEQK